MAGNDDRNGIRSIGEPHGTDAFGIANGFREISIAASFPKRNFLELPPNTALEGTSFGIEREFEGFSLFLEELLQLLRRFFKKTIFGVFARKS